MIETISRILEMPLKDDNETDTAVVKNEEIHENDVLMGRGGKNNRHVGNENLRDVARGQVEKYKVSTKKIKSAISRDIVKQVRGMDPPGRFLKRVPETGEWEDVGDYLAREKVAQVLRDAVCEAAEATRPSIHPAMYPSGGPYNPYPENMAAASVFRQGPGTEYFAMDDEARRSAIPGVVTASASSSFGHPGAPGFHHMPHPWHPHGPQQPPPHPYPGMPPPFPQGFQPPHPQHYAAAAAAGHPPYMRPPPTSPRPSEGSTQTTPGRTRGGGSSAFGPAYSISLSVAAAPGATPLSSHTEAFMSWHPPSPYATPVPGKGRRKRSRSLPGESPDKSTPPDSNSPAAAPKSTTKTSSATQTPTFVLPGFAGSTGANRPGVTSQTHTPLWEQPSQPAAAAAAMPPYPSANQRSPQEHAYFRQHSQHSYFDQHQQSAHQQQQPPHHPHPPIRSYSAPLPQELLRAAGGESRDNSDDSSSNSPVQRSRHASFSSRKVPKRESRQKRPTSFEAIVPKEEEEEEGEGTGTIEPLPAQEQHVEGEESPPRPMPALPNQNLARAPSRRGSRAASPGPAAASQGPTAAEAGLDWFEGQLLLESDEDDSERGNIKDQYPV